MNVDKSETYILHDQGWNWNKKVKWNVFVSPKLKEVIKEVSKLLSYRLEQEEAFVSMFADDLTHTDNSTAAKNIPRHVTAHMCAPFEKMKCGHV